MEQFENVEFSEDSLVPMENDPLGLEDPLLNVEPIPIDGTLANWIAPQTILSTVPIETTKSDNSRVLSLSKNVQNTTRMDLSLSGDEGRDFIWMIKDKPILWDSRINVHESTTKRNEVWTEIGNAFGLTPNDTFKTFIKLKAKYATNKDLPTMDDTLIELSFLDPVIDFEREKFKQSQEAQVLRSVKMPQENQNVINFKSAHSSNYTKTNIPESHQLSYVKNGKTFLLPKGVRIQRINPSKETIVKKMDIKDAISQQITDKLDPFTEKGRRALMTLVENNHEMWKRRSLKSFPYVCNHWSHISTYFTCNGQSLYNIFIGILKDRSYNRQITHDSTNFLDEIIANTLPQDVPQTNRQLSTSSEISSRHLIMSNEHSVSFPQAVPKKQEYRISSNSFAIKKNHPQKNNPSSIGTITVSRNKTYDSHGISIETPTILTTAPNICNGVGVGRTISKSSFRLKNHLANKAIAKHIALKLTELDSVTANQMCSKILTILSNFMTVKHYS